MKKIILPVLLVGGLTLFSFTKSTNGGVGTTGQSLEQKSTGLKFAQQSKVSSDKNYDLTKTQLIKSKTKDGIESMVKGNWILKSKLTLGIFDANFVTWDSPTVPAPATPALAILEKYSSVGSYTKINDHFYGVVPGVNLSADEEKEIRTLIEKEYNLTVDQVKKTHTKEGLEFVPKLD